MENDKNKIPKDPADDYLEELNVNYSDVVDLIIERRKKNNLSKQEMAKRLDISPAAYAKIEKGKTRLSVERIIEVCKALNISVFKVMRMLVKDEELEELRLRNERYKRGVESLRKVYKSIHLYVNQLFGKLLEINRSDNLSKEDSEEIFDKIKYVLDMIDLMEDQLDYIELKTSKEKLKEDIKQLEKMREDLFNKNQSDSTA